MKTSFVACVVTALVAAAPALAFDGWHLESATAIEGSKGASFDYITFDVAKNRLFLGHRKEGLHVYDIATRKVVKTIDKTAEHSSNGALLLPEFDLAISNNEDGTITPFKLSTLEAGDAIKLGEELDTSHYDESTKRIFVNLAAGKDGTDIIVLEAPSLKQIGVIKVATRKAEHAEGDGKGNFYLASRDLELVYKIDAKTMKVTAEWPTPGCGQTNSLALNHADNRILLGCRGNAKTPPSFAVLNPETGKITFTVETGGGNDGVIYDAATKRVFVANGLGANLHVLEPVKPDEYKTVEVLGTRPMAKVLAYDAKNQKLYSMTAETSADFGKKINTAIGPFYPNTFIPGTFSVLAYSK